MAPVQGSHRARKAVAVDPHASPRIHSVPPAAAAAPPSYPAKSAIAPRRPVRFVTSGDEPLTKRRRISAACRTCQKKKTKCSGEKPGLSEGLWYYDAGMVLNETL